MAAGAVRDACRAALEARATRGGAEVDVERVYRHPPDLGPRPRDRPGARRAGARRARDVRDAGRRRGRRRARAHARRLDRHRAGRRQGAQPAGRDGPDRGRHRPGDRPRADGGDPDARRPDRERELHRLPAPDGARHAAGRVGADRGSRSPTRRTASRASASRPTVVSTAAVVAAMRDATGKPLRRAPVRPDEICLVAERVRASPAPTSFRKRLDHPLRLAPDHERDRREHDGRADDDLPASRPRRGRSRPSRIATTGFT